ncbi:hypothetical protein KHM83_05655 [Fusibacter paucivorans]|uniref:DUF1097 domain-containing protein n=1 Tax=Fusibacter paucivorans TaxID=76009 RepID=A0ABS5PLY5_9FIRM|nr:hypothetical protein [Fusibacter paucivorans]MBS7526153.1 hypothetical protein [Fusibacter paucivorans]
MNDTKVSVKEGILLAVILTVLLAAFSIITGKIGYTEAWAGYMFFWFWSTIRHFEKELVISDFLNSIVGIALGFGVFTILHTYGMAVFESVTLLVLLVVLFFSITKIIPYIIGDTTFLFFTVLTSHALLSDANYVQISASYVLGAIFFILTISFVFKLMHKTEPFSD